jgi:hypothetical protein
MAKVSARVQLAKFWHDGHRQAWIDIGERWGPALAWLFLAGLSTCFALLCTLTQASGRVKTACSPDGTFRLEPEKFHYWSTGFFQITLGFGNMSFTAAKVVDVVWDVVSMP